MGIRTFKSVVQELEHGLRNGSITLRVWTSQSAQGTATNALPGTASSLTSENSESKVRAQLTNDTPRDEAIAERIEEDGPGG